MSDTVLVNNQSVQDQRANAVKAEIESLQSKTEDCVFDLCDLLKEARDGSYHQTFHFARFSDWIAMSPQFDLSPRQAAYYINIAEKALRLEVDRPTLKRIKMSKLKEIFSLDPDVHREEMLALLAEAEAMSLDEVKARVRYLKSDAGEEEVLYMTIKYLASAKEGIDLAFEKARREIGTYQNKQGEQTDPPNGQVLEFICADFAGGPSEDVQLVVDDPLDTYIVNMEEGVVAA